MSVTINGTTGIDKVLPDTVAQSEVIQDIGSLSSRNKIINGNFNHWQRGSSQTSNGYGSDDRWTNSNIGSTKTHSRQEFTLGQTDVPGTPKYFSRTVVTSVAGAGNYCLKIQKIEGVHNFSNGYCTLSFYAKADATKNIAIEFVQNFGDNGSPSDDVTGIGSQLVQLTTSWEKHIITVYIPSITGKTIGTLGNDRLGINFWFDAGSDHNSRTSSLGQQSGTFDIAQVQLEEGSEATPFEQRPIGLEFSLCQRYYQVLYKEDTGNLYINASLGDCFGGCLVLQTPMRAIPTITTLTSPAFNNCTFDQWVHNSIDSSSKSMFVTTTTGGQIYRCSGGSYALDAEL